MVAVLNELVAGDICALIDILHLRTATLEEPVLNAGDGFVLVIAEVGVEVEEVVGTDKLDLRCAKGYGASHVGTPAMGIAIPSLKIFAVNLEELGLILSTNRPAVALVVLSGCNGGVVERGVDGMSTSDLTGNNKVQTNTLLRQECFAWAEFQTSDEILGIVGILAVDALSVHDLGLVAQEAVVGFAKEREAEVTAILHAEERVAAAAGEDGDALGVNVDGLHDGWGHRIL